MLVPGTSRVQGPLGLWATLQNPSVNPTGVNLTVVGSGAMPPNPTFVRPAMAGRIYGSSESEAMPQSPLARHQGGLGRFVRTAANLAGSFTPWRPLHGETSHPGLGRVLDKSTRVQVQVLEKMTSTSTSTGFSKVLEYKYKYF